MSAQPVFDVFLKKDPVSTFCSSELGYQLNLEDGWDFRNPVLLLGVSGLFCPSVVVEAILVPYWISNPATILLLSRSTRLPSLPLTTKAIK